MAGRKSKLNRELIKKIYSLISKGNYDIVVFEALNIGSSTYYEWIAEGTADLEAGKTNLKTELVETVQKARAVAEIRAVDLIQKAGEKHWQANAWFLERKYADRWRQQIKTEVEGLQFNILLPDDIIPKSDDEKP